MHTHLLGKGDMLKVGADDMFDFPQGVNRSLHFWIQANWGCEPRGTHLRA